MLLQENNNVGGNRDKKRKSEIVRVYEEYFNRGSCYQTRNELSSGLCCLAEYARPLSITFPPRMEKLWGKGHKSLSKMGEKFLRLLAGYGADVQKRFNVGAAEQQQRIFEEKLRMGYAQTTSQQHAKKPFYRHAVGKNDSESGCPEIRDKQHDTPLSFICGRSPFTTFHDTRFYKPVFDIINAGPRQRFTVLGNGGPILVHNCCQAVARDIMAWNMERIERAGYDILLSVHDELITEAPDNRRFSHGQLSKLLSTQPDWADGIPLAAGGFESYRYRKDD